MAGNAFATGHTHYLSYFVSHSRGLQVAVCGTAIDRSEHSCEATCPTCRAWLRDEEMDAQETAAALEREFPGHGYGQMFGGGK